MNIKVLLLPVFLSLALSGCIVTSAVNLAATTVMTAGKIAVKGTGALINAAIPGKDKKKDKEKKSREQQADDYLEEPREE
ncbi:NF038104 family lipoprotein [Neisseria sp. HMSC70E02]|uniref:NF038104 family lipoprotein n=1 Tax=Neisseria sp. HMSC70E02 TaxID=1608896 RepID=UPI0008A9409D|nr:NF038104 family lipoprotein [Neisseria sp. HMSC70E02]OHR74834.1 stress responsive alpha-beta barrel [Neisseria sp. HMSC70E02]